MVIIGLDDVSTDRKTGENLAQAIRERIRYVENICKVRVIAFTSDSAGDARMARRLLAQERPDLVFLPCYAHQVGVCDSQSHVSYLLTVRRNCESRLISLSGIFSNAALSF